MLLLWSLCCCVIILALANIAVLFLRTKSYKLENYLINRDIKRNFTTYSSRLDDYLEQGDYYKFNRFYYYKSLYYSDVMNPYEELISLSQPYVKVFDDIQYLVIMNTTNYYMSTNELLDDVASCIQEFYEVVDEDSYVKKYTTQQGRIHADEMVDKMNNLLTYYLKLTDEQIKKLPTLSKSQIAIEIGRGLGIYD